MVRYSLGNYFVAAAASAGFVGYALLNPGLVIEANSEPSAGYALIGGGLAFALVGAALAALALGGLERLVEITQRSRQ